MAIEYPELTPEPENLVYPIFFNITAESKPEPAGGISRVNMYNISQIVTHMIWVVESKLASPEQIGIATPYAGQVALYYDILRKLRKDKPEHKWLSIRVGTTEWWMGGQAEYMIVDLVRATNDIAELGFLAEGRRLNVLISRQEQALIIVGDKDCVNPVVTGSEKEDRRVLNSRNYDNRQVIKMFDWLTKHGRLVEIPRTSLSQDYVKLNPISGKAVEPETGATSGDVSGDAGESGWGVVPASGGGADESGWGVVPASGGGADESGWGVVPASGDAGTSGENAWGPVLSTEGGWS